MNIRTTNLHEIMNRATPHLVGFDSLIRLLEDTGTALNGGAYPPYNIVQDSEHAYRIELAVAGFKEEEINITVENRKLLIVGRKDDSEERNYLHRGISTRAFERSFVLAQDVEIRDASLVDGMLLIELEHIVPEALQPKKIDIRVASKSKK